MSWSEITDVNNSWLLQFINSYVAQGYWLSGYTVDDGTSWNETLAQNNSWQEEADFNNTWTEITQNTNTWL
jgi:hypothetical protein